MQRKEIVKVSVQAQIWCWAQNSEIIYMFLCLGILVVYIFIHMNDIDKTLNIKTDYTNVMKYITTCIA